MQRKESLLAEKGPAAPDSTAVRVALWRAMHVRVDPPPHVLEDEIGLKLVAPDQSWRQRPDMDPHNMSRARASVVSRARFIEDLVVEQAGLGLSQYVLLGAGLDTFAQRRPQTASRIRVFEVDQPGSDANSQPRGDQNILIARSRGCEPVGIIVIKLEVLARISAI